MHGSNDHPDKEVNEAITTLGVALRSRLFTEYEELRARIKKLEEFIIGEAYDGLPEIDRSDLKTQLKHMKAYCEVLSCRVSRLCNNA